MMNRTLLALILGLGLSAGCQPADDATASGGAPGGTSGASQNEVPVPQASTPEASAGTASAGDFAGRYTLTKDNGLVDGETFKSTDVLDIIALDETRAFLNAELLFFNGHMCSISGLASMEGMTLVLRGTADGLYPGCALTLSRKGDQLTFTDPDGMCTKASCGARGSYTDYAMPLAGRTEHTSAQLDEIRTGQAYLVATGATPGEKQ
jgi:hypothetical protein